MPTSRPKVSRRAAENAVRTLLQWAGEDPRREGLQDTPQRVVNAYRDWFSGYQIDPAAYLPDAPPGSAEQSLDKLVAHNRKSAKTHSGIWRDLAVRKRPTEVDAQLGIVVSLGAEAGVPTPITARVVGLIHEIERGVRPLQLENLDAVAS